MLCCLFLRSFAGAMRKLAGNARYWPEPNEFVKLDSEAFNVIESKNVADRKENVSLSK